MPDYEVTSPSGKKIIITGDQFPSESELDEIFASVEPKEEMGFMEALGKSLKPEGAIPSIPGQISREGAGLLEVGMNLLSTPSRLLYSAFSDKPYDEALAEKTELGKVALGDTDTIGGQLGSMALDVAGDPTNLFMGGLGVLSKIGKVSKEVSALTKINKSEDFLKVIGGKSEKQIDNILGYIDKNIKKVDSEDAVKLAFVKDHIKQATGRAKATPLKEMTAVDRVTNAIKEAKPIRKKQNALYKKERREQAKVLNAIDKRYSGAEADIKKREYLKGKTLGKVDYEGINVSQADVEELFNLVKNSDKLTTFEKMPATDGLRKLLGDGGGVVPRPSELKLLEKVFPEELIDTALSKRSTMAKLMDMGANIINLPRAMMATADLSAPLRQGIFMIRRQKQFAPAFKNMFKYAFSEKAYDDLLEEIASRPTYELMKESKLSITDLGRDLSTREEAFMSNLAEKIPVFGKLARGSNRAYSGFLDKLRADVFDDMIKFAEKSGLDVDDVADDIASYVNAATGRGSLGKLEKAAPVLNATLFSPRLVASRLQLVGKVFNPNTTRFVRKEMIKDWLGFLGTGMTALTLAKLGGAEVVLDPRNSDFGKIKFGDTRYDIWGGFQQYAVLLGRLITRQMVSSTTGKEFNLGEGYKPTTELDILARSAEYKTSPLASFAIGFTRGQTGIGKEFRVGPEILDRMIPIVAQDVTDIIREEGLQSVYKVTPAPFGVGVQTYGDRIPSVNSKGEYKLRPEYSIGERIYDSILPQKPNDPLLNLMQQKGVKIPNASRGSMTNDEFKKYRAIRDREFKRMMMANIEGIRKQKTEIAQKTINRLSQKASRIANSKLGR